MEEMNACYPPNGKNKLTIGCHSELLFSTIYSGGQQNCFDTVIYFFIKYFVCFCSIL